jgi:hypothetical protein
LALATLVEDMNDCHQPCATRVHMFPLLHRKKERPHVDLIQSPVNDLHNFFDQYLFKNNIVSTIPYNPNQCTNSNSNLSFNNTIYLIKPIPKHIGYIVRWCNVKSTMDNSSYTFDKRTRNKKMINRFLSITKNTFRAPIWVPFC